MSLLASEVVGDESDTSDDLAMKHLAFFLGGFSFGESKRDEGVLVVVTMAATTLFRVSSSSSSLPEEYSSRDTKTTLEGFLLGFLLKGFL
jgi:hypothetical protein